MNRLLISMILWMLALLPLDAAQTRLESKLDELDAYLERADEYVKAKERKIGSLQSRLEYAATDEDLYELNYSLFVEYQSFKYDSAYFYASRSLHIAESMNDAEKTAVSQCALVFCYLSSGLFKEAFDVIALIRPEVMSDEWKREYYTLYNRLCYDFADYSNAAEIRDRYISEGDVYAEKLKEISSPDSYHWKYAQAQLDIKHNRFDDCVRIYTDILENHEIDEHTKAIIYSSIGGACRYDDDPEGAMYNMAQAAVCDILSATKETTALYVLAELLCDYDNSSRSYRYIHYALEDADFYNARHRKLSINPILPVIEQARLDSVMKQRNLMLVIVILCALLVAGSFYAFSRMAGKNRMLRKRSQQLAEANRIKEEYIGHSFYVNAEFIAENEDLYKTIHQKLVARQYDDLDEMTKLSRMNKRRESMYESFDKCFLKIFPSFVAEYAKLFPEGEIDPDSTTLTSEMRIFALIRLGITDSERIARFLNYSVHTIYTYKTRVKNRSVVSNEEFEARIKAVEIQ